MARKAVTCAPTRLVLPPALDTKTAERVAQWVTRWHSADYEIDDISEMLDDWPAEISLADLIEPFSSIDESDSTAELARFVLDLIRLVERGALQTTHARGAFRLACRQLCTRGIPFEETAKGDETALWFHFISVNEFGDVDNQGYSTDFTELRLMARYLIDREQLLRELLDGEFPTTFQEGYVSICGAIGDSALAPHMIRILRRSEDVQQVASSINVLGRLQDPDIVGLLEGYAYSTNEDIATTAVLAIEALGTPEAERILRQVQSLMPDELTPLGAHIAFGLLHLEEGPEVLRDQLHEIAANGQAETMLRLAAIERLSGSSDVDTIRLMERMLDDATYERVSVDGYLTDDVVYTIQEAAYMALIDCRISTLVEVLGEGILDRLESFKMYTMPSWWTSFEPEPSSND